MKFYSATLKNSISEDKANLEIQSQFLDEQGWLMGDEICIKVVKDRIELINQSKAVRDRKN